MNSQSRLSLVKLEPASGSAEACALPATQSDRTKDLAADFLSWHKLQSGGALLPVNIESVHQWAAASGIELTAAQIIEILDACKAKPKEPEKPQTIGLTLVKTPTPYTDMLAKQVRFERERADHEKEVQELERMPGPIEKAERDRKTEQNHHSVKSITTCSPSMSDRMSTKMLEHKLRMNQVAPEDIANVEQFLAELCAELKQKLKESRRRPLAATE